MKPMQVAILFVCALIPFLFFFSSQNFADPDSYYYLNAICHDEVLHNTPDIFNFVVSFLPCNIFFLKFLVFLLYLGCIFVTAKTGELFNQEKGWVCGLVLASMTLFVTESWKFENDMWGYFFGFLAIYFFCRFRLHNTFFSSHLLDKNLLKGLFCLVLAGVFWNGAVYWLIPLAFMSLEGILLLLIAIFLSRDIFFNFLSQSELVLENARWIGLAYFGIATLFILGIVKSKKWVAGSFIVLTIMTIFQSKLFVLAIPFLCIIVLDGIQIAVSEKYWNLFLTALIVFSLFMSCFWGLSSLNQFPQDSDILLIKKAAELSPEHVENDFSAGYILRYYGTNPQCEGKLCSFQMKGYVVTLNDVNSTCPVIQTSDYLRLFECPV